MPHSAQCPRPVHPGRTFSAQRAGRVLATDQLGSDIRPNAVDQSFREESEQRLGATFDQQRVDPSLAKREKEGSETYVRACAFYCE